MDKKKDDNMLNIIFRVVIIGAFFMGIRAIYNFYIIIERYALLDGEDLFNRVESMLDDYMMFIIFTISALVFGILLKKYTDKKVFAIRTTAIVVSLITGIMSLITMVQFACIAVTKYSDIAQIVEKALGMSMTLEQIYESPLTTFLIDKPYLFYAYFVGVAIFAVLMITSIYSLVNKSDKKNLL